MKIHPRISYDDLIDGLFIKSNGLFSIPLDPVIERDAGNFPIGWRPLISTRHWNDFSSHSGELRKYYLCVRSNECAIFKSDVICVSQKHMLVRASAHTHDVG